jgi:predicted alpha/beta-fold hydrolase
MKLLRLAIALLAIFCATSHALAAEALVRLSTRGSEEVSYWWMPNDAAKATVLLFSGGNGGIGFRDGKPQSGNFLIRSRDHFFAQGFNVALVGNPSDKRQLDDNWRVSKEHMTDVRTILENIQKKSTAPVWIVGTSRGTVSAAAIGRELQDAIKGVVLTASLTSYGYAHSVSKQALDRIRLPVLVYHHKDDACRVTMPSETQWIMRGLTNASAKKLMIVSGGADPRGDECEAFHWHGFIGMEEQAVRDIGAWILNPQP